MASCKLSAQSEGDSDSDWDDDDDFASKKITIKIKPIAQITPNKISASVDELRATVGTWKSLASINLVKPNSRRHHQSSVQLDNNNKLPVAFAIQECINANLNKLANNNGNIINGNSNGTFSADNNNSNSSSSPTTNGTTSLNNNNNNQVSLIGSLKMAVPPKLVTMDPTTLDRCLEFELITSLPWDNIRLNDEFVRESADDHQSSMDSSSSSFNRTPHQHPFALSSSSSSSLSSNSTKRLIINMESIQAYVKQQNQKHPNSKYFVLPELLKYVIGSQQDKQQQQLQNNNNHHPSSIADVSTRVSPLHVIAHWLCDLTITKVRVDVQFLENTVDNLGLSIDDIKNLKISMHINGGVVNYQSKPEAHWDSLNSRLTWSFANLNELIQKSTQNGITSCLARLDLNGGPSTPSDVKIEFSILGKTLTGAQVILNGTNFHIAKQKYEVRTGAFICKSPCI